MAALASTRFLVQSSRGSGRRQLQRSNTAPKNLAPCLVATAPCGRAPLHTYTYSRHRPISTSLSKDLSVLASLESSKAHDGATKQGWSSWEVLASAVLAVAATGSFLMGSTMTSPSFSPKLIHRGGGGGGGGGGSGGSPAPISIQDEEEVVTVLDDGGGDSYQVCNNGLSLNTRSCIPIIDFTILLYSRFRFKLFEVED